MFTYDSMISEHVYFLDLLYTFLTVCIINFCMFNNRWCKFEIVQWIRPWIWAILFEHGVVPALQAHINLMDCMVWRASRLEQIILIWIMFIYFTSRQYQEYKCKQTIWQKICASYTVPWTLKQCKVCMASLYFILSYTDLNNTIWWHTLI